MTVDARQTPLKTALHVVLIFIAVPCVAEVRPGPGAWPEPRQNRHLTAIQPMPGNMTDAPAVIATYETARTRPAVTLAKLPGEKVVSLSAVNGELRCYNADGSIRWKIHPPGLNFTKIVACEDFDGDGTTEVAVEAGRPTQPYGAAALVSVDDGRLIWRYDVDPMSYDWHLYAGRYLPGAARPQLVVLMHGYPPDTRNGYIALFDCSTAGARPVQKWRHDFEVYTCFPSFLQTDLDADGIDELAVETHSHMWLFDAVSGGVKQYLAWDVSPANERSYGHVEFVDLNRDGRKDFLCVANFAKHFEVLLNENGKLKKAWHHGWEDSVTTAKMALTWPLPPYGDVDGDGDIELIVSVFDVDGAWSLRVHDAVTGALQARKPGMVAEALADVDGDGTPEVLASAASTRSRARPDGGHVPDPRGGAHVLSARGGEIKTLWSDAAASPVRGAGPARIQRGDRTFTLALPKHGAPIESLWESVPPRLLTRARPLEGGRDASSRSLFGERGEGAASTVNAPIIADVATPPVLLAADLIGDSRNELILYEGSTVTLVRVADNRFEKVRHYESSCQPAIGDLDGDGHNELILADIGATHQPSIKVLTPSNADKSLWQTTLPPPLVNIPAPRLGYVRTGHFTGKPMPDIYFCAGQPAFASVMLDGRNGKLVWSASEFKEVDRPAGPTQNHAAAYDCDGDGREDLVFTAPDYFCVLSGDAGKLLAGPLLPATIFHQPSQGLYTFPAILDRTPDEPLVALVGGHYFQGVMSLKASPLWHALPTIGQARAGHEGFLREGRDEVPLVRRQWLMGFGRQNGRFACVNVSDGSTRWETDVAATCTDVAACDVDGDGAQEFIFGTSHGTLYAVGDRNGSPRVLWKVELGTALGAPIVADLTGDGKSDIAVATHDGRVLLLSR